MESTKKTESSEERVAHTPQQDLTTLKLVEIGDAVLKQVAKRVTTEETLELAARMGSLMHAAHGIGLAAPQVGISLRFFILDIDGSMMAFTNPEILGSHGEVWGDEGCLSIPVVRLRIRRAKSVTVKADGWKHTRVFDGLWARAIQHEVDHLNGILITDRANEQSGATAAHEALVDALRAAQDALLGYDGSATDPDNHEGWSSSDGFFAYKKVRDALAKVEGE